MRLIVNKKIKFFMSKCYHLLNNERNFSSSARGIILGIETSCDDTGCAIVDTEGNVLGEALHSQHLIHLNNGGIIPPIAQDLHRKNIENVVSEAVNAANIHFREIDAIATTVKPGLPLSLKIGTTYGKYLCRLHKKPFIPIHHMEAHALTARMHDKSIEFPFLVLLISGGHCLLAVAKKVDKFLLLGEGKDDAPGEAFDKLARRMKLKNIPEYSQLCGGQAIEKAALKADDPLRYKFTIPLLQYKDCNFSFSGIKNQLLLQLFSEEKEENVPPDGVIPGVSNLCAGLQLVMTRHLCHRVQRGMEYVARKGIIPPNKQTLVVSGGAACNNFIATGLQMVCDELGYKMVRPPPKLCTDNGVMIAWNGVERWKENIGVFEDFEHIDIEKCSPLGERLIEEVTNESISCKWVKLSKLNLPQSRWNTTD
ncbi:probable tRNA N6-adenosine threonylcarbamoyltransferase, mitochondrial [Anoplophora glabripennis]|uniref:probable tRNA N6-adenosine threonylcarbamoyltransferase, mitochondrial n=1 Tax=Anoplophora glabripennis TaxID=217634 RepID=UPI000873AC88|nr:probable tRNA N6-adenosine threonylcarbamoyltransferase, mitochondrial [Anoplophora glabripennis]